MTGRRSTARRAQRELYLASRTAGDIAAAQSGPQALAKRVARRALTRALFRAFRAR